MKFTIFTQNAPDLTKLGLPLSQGTMDDTGLIFISGQLPLLPETLKIVEGGIEAQTKQVMENLKAILGAVNCEFEDVLKANVRIVDSADSKIFNSVYGEYFENCDPPAREMYPKKPGQIAFESLIEISMIATMPSIPKEK